MALLSNLTVALTVKSGDFYAKLQGAAKQVQRFDKRIADGSARLQKHMAVAGGTIVASVLAAGTAIGYLVNQQMEAIDATAKLADRLGETTENIVGLQNAAELGGSSIEEMGKASEQLARRLGKPTTETTQALKLLNLQASELMKLSPAAQLGAIGDAMNRTASAEARIAAANGLFGEAGVKLINTLSVGTEGLRAITEEAKATGQAFNRIDGAKVEQANDAITRLKQAFTGIVTILTVKLAGPIAAAADKLREFLTNAEGVSSTLDKIFDGTRSAIRGLLNFMEDASITFQETAATILKLVGEIQKATGRFNGESLETVGARLGTNASLSEGAAEQGRTAVDPLALISGTDLFNKAAARRNAIESGQTKRLGDRFIEEMEKRIAKISETATQTAVAAQARVDASRTAVVPDASVERAAIRGTFGSENAGRIAENRSNEKKMIDLAEKQLRELIELRQNMRGGAPISF